MFWGKAVLVVGVVAVAVGGCSSPRAGHRVETQRPAAAAQERADTAMWMQCARSLVSRAKDTARRGVQREAATLDLEGRDRLMEAGLDAAYLVVENGCGMAPFYGIRMRQAVRQLWLEV